MMQEDKELLLKDLCARLPYEPFAQWHHKALNEFRDVKIMRVSTYGENIDDYHINVLCQPEPGVDYEASIVDIKPYLRPISSMTDEEREQYRKFSYYGAAGYRNNDYKEMVATPSFEKMDFLNAHHFDYRGLIEKGLAIEAPEGMYNIKEQ